MHRYGAAAQQSAEKVAEEGVERRAAALTQHHSRLVQLAGERAAEVEAAREAEEAAKAKQIEQEEAREARRGACTS